MPLETIYVVRHGFRSSWSVDHTTGVYSASIPSPTGIAVDPALTAHGVDQSRQLAQHLMTTITPFVELQQEKQHHGQRTSAGSDAPLPPPSYGLNTESASVLKSLFPAFDESYVSAQHPPKRGETLAQLQARLTATMQSIIDRCDAEDRRAVVLCTHAAVVIMLGRILTGDFPETVDADDFRAFTCGLSVYRRRLNNRDEGLREKGDLPDKEPNPSAAAAAVGGWSCEANSDCRFLINGEERGWKFVGDEEFPDTGSMSQGASESKL
ncbi:hypothetical protein TrVFT333_008456 [Trichoderma virens FT-333]|nr:hypothetical protein TrVFT333_008456 [Trichoderma virens FT-333]